MLPLTVTITVVRGKIAVSKPDDVRVMIYDTDNLETHDYQAREVEDSNQINIQEGNDTNAKYYRG